MDWFYRFFPWIGLVGALVLTGFLAPAIFRARHRHRHIVWSLTYLSWAGVAAYLFHNVEEYGIDFRGVQYGFPAAFCTIFGYSGPYPICPVPPMIFAAVNVPLFWIAAPMAAWLSRRHHLVGLSIYGVMMVNALAHIGEGGISGSIYNSGLLTAVCLFLPLSGWMIYTQFVRGYYSARALAFVFFWGVVGHAILLLSFVSLVRGWIHEIWPVAMVQCVNAALFIIGPLLAERWMGTGIYKAEYASVFQRRD